MNRTISANALNWWKKFAALAIFGLLFFSVCSIGFAVLHQSEHELTEPWCLVAAFESLPATGEPQRYPLLQVSRDAWEFRDPKPVGSVYLRRLPNTNSVVAFSAASPHLACQLRYDEEKKCFSSCCFLNEDFDLLGHRLGSDHPAPRDMDQFETSVRDGQVWVKFEQFEPSIGMSPQQHE
jgi:hypothetical protein